MDEFVDLLRASAIDLVVDVRTAPGSRRVPHFAKSSLSAELPSRGIEYVHMLELGGLRKSTPDSPNTGWRNASFRAYADYMQTEAFQIGLNRLVAMATGRTLTIMFAEALPSRSHRSLLAAALPTRVVYLSQILRPFPTRVPTHTPVCQVHIYRRLPPPPHSPPT